MGFPGLPGHLQEGGPILVCNLFSLMGLLVTCDQLPSPTEQRYLCFPPPFASVQSGIHWEWLWGPRTWFC